MSSVNYTTKDGDVLDEILTEYYTGTGSVFVEGVTLLQFVLLANPGLAERGPVYPSGVVIVLPDPPVTTSLVPTIRPWS